MCKIVYIQVVRGKFWKVLWIDETYFGLSAAFTKVNTTKPQITYSMTTDKADAQYEAQVYFSQ